MREKVFLPNDVSVVLPDHIIRPIEKSPDYNITIIMHSVAFVQKMNQRRLTHNRNKFHKFPACRLTDEELANYMKAVAVLEHISDSPVTRYPNRLEMLLAQTDIMTEMLDACRREMDGDAKKQSRNQMVFSDFCNLLAQHYRDRHEVAFYADKAHLTTRHFSVIIKDNVGMSANDYIEQYIVTQAKNLIASRPDLSIKQISNIMGFAESPSFCRFFKRKAGLTPQQYRKGD